VLQEFTITWDDGLLDYGQYDGKPQQRAREDNMKVRSLLSVWSIVALILSVSVASAQWTVFMDGSVLPDAQGWEKEKPTGDPKDPSTMSTVVDDPDISGNKLLKMENLDGTDRGFWIYYLEDLIADSSTVQWTLAFRIKATEGAVAAAAAEQGIATLRWGDIRLETGLVREYFRFAQDTLSLERQGEDLDGISVADWHTFRASFDAVSGDLKVYMDENATPIYSGVMTDPSSNYRMRFGDSGLERNHGCYYDWIIIDMSGAYAPGENDAIPDEVIVLATNDRPAGAPASYKLIQNFPNPFNPTTTIGFDVSAAGMVKIMVYDILGREITSLVNQPMQAGNYSVVWNATDMNGVEVPAGIYIARLITSGSTQSIKMVLMK